ncbi:MAG: hypothetical protein QM809_17940 [Gordonia sp. (in: high G+C Gram-positive bacteria)]|uniref:hypothetical protein n=1 Tax=Gordonia sp. (in: high G+C Gram-positive bacteria) TaxID=84139 RepID=UPI0039E60368
MQQRRLYFSAITLVAVFGFATVAVLPWLQLPGLGLSWNGLGRTSDESLAATGITPEPRGWLVLTACLAVLLAALPLLRSTTRGTAPALWLAALCAAAGSAVPLTVLIDPDWFLGGFLSEIGAVEFLGRGRELLNVPVLGFCAGAMILLTLLCAATALTVAPLRWRISITRTDASKKDADRPEPSPRSTETSSRSTESSPPETESSPRSTEPSSPETEPSPRWSSEVETTPEPESDTDETPESAPGESEPEADRAATRSAD